MNFPGKLLLSNNEVLKVRKAFASSSSANIKLSKTQLHKIWQSWGFLGWLLGPLLKHGLSLIGNLLKPLAKSVLITLGLTASAVDVAIHTKMLGSGNTTSIILNKKMNHHENNQLSWRIFSKTIKNEPKEQKGGFFSVLLVTLGAILLGHRVAGKDY